MPPKSSDIRLSTVKAKRLQMPNLHMRSIGSNAQRNLVLKEQGYKVLLPPNPSQQEIQKVIQKEIKAIQVQAKIDKLTKKGVKSGSGKPKPMKGTSKMPSHVTDWVKDTKNKIQDMKWFSNHIIGMQRLPSHQLREQFVSNMTLNPISSTNSTVEKLTQEHNNLYHRITSSI